MIDVIVPKTGMETEPVEVLEILVSVGDLVDEGQPLMEVEGPKITFEIAAECAGTVAEILVAVGDERDPGSVIARLSV
ncbi:MAG: biotin/lipoyl-containing protein [Actinomycetes bacterium]|jgi:pyruvate/2-oxoglutarate dehydrogenase complex dihydrolipoamide acyltransferase (E2) component